MQKIKMIREALNLKQNEFSAALDISQTYLSAIETGRRQFTSKLANILFKKFNVSPEWLYNDNGNIFNSTMGNTDGVNDGVNHLQNASLDKEGDMSTLLKKYADAFLYPGSFEGDKIHFYYKLTDNQLDSLFSTFLNDYKQVFNDYLKLIKLSNDFGSPDFFREKFPLMPDFKQHKEDTDSDFLQFHGHMTNKKLLKCVQLVEYEGQIEHYHKAISQLITYMDMYVNLFKGYTKESQFNKD